MSVNKVNSDGSLLRISGGTLYVDAPIGSISPFGGSVIPSGYLLCDGSEVLKTAYADLYAVIGDSFGMTFDNTKFKLPDLRETVPVGTGTKEEGVANHDIYTLGEFKDDQLKDHVHNVYGVQAALSGSGYPVLTNTQYNVNGKTREVDDSQASVGTTTHGKQLGVNYIIKAKSIGAPLDIVESVKDALQPSILQLVDTINYAKTQNYCYRATTNGVGVDIPFDEIESYSDGNYTARIHVMVARKMNSGDLYYKTFIDIPIAKGTDPNTGLTIKSYGFIPDWTQESKSLPSSDGGYNNGIEVVLQRGTYDGVERDVVGMWYNYSVFDNVKKVVVYMPTEVGFITNSQVATYIEKIQIFKLG